MRDGVLHISAAAAGFHNFRSIHEEAENVQFRFAAVHRVKRFRQ